MNLSYLVIALQEYVSVFLMWISKLGLLVEMIDFKYRGFQSVPFLGLITSAP